MAQITVEEVYNGAKYDVISAAVTKYLRNGRPAEYDEQTCVDMLLVKYSLILADKMKIGGRLDIGNDRLRDALFLCEVG